MTYKPKPESQGFKDFAGLYHAIGLVTPEIFNTARTR